MATDQKIKEMVGIISKTYNVPLTPELIVSWGNAVAEYHDGIVELGTTELINTWHWEPYKPKTPPPANLREICKQIAKSRTVTNQIESEEQKNQQLLLTTDKNQQKVEAKHSHKLIANHLAVKKALGTVESTSDYKPDPDFNIVENMEPNGEKIHSFQCYGHVDVDEFRRQCLYWFFVSPMKVIHCYMQDGKTHYREKGVIKQTVFHLKRCNMNSPDAMEITLGYV